MKILYAIQGTGNGHLCRALDVVPALKKFGEVDLLVSGIQADINLPFKVKYKLHGLSFIFGKKGGVDLWKTYKSSTVKRFLKEIKELPVEAYDLVINDFEPISAWACLKKNKECIGLSHQIAALDLKSPKPKESDLMGKIIMKNYAPVSHNYGFHFKSYSDTIFTPVIRQEVRALEVSDLGHYTVYLPSYSDKSLIQFFSKFKTIHWQIFSKHNKKEIVVENVTINPINSKHFLKSLASSSGVICGAGFETPAETLYLGKKLLVIPMKNQYEQHLNAATLAEMGIPVISKLKPKYYTTVENWIENGEALHIHYPDQTEEIIKRIIDKHTKKD